MKSLFPEYFPLTDNQFDELWRDSIVVFDTNVLLRLYRYKETTVSEILTILKGLGDRLWIPYQVAWEYNRRRITKIKEAEKSYTDLIAAFQTAASGVKSRLSTLKEFGVHPHMNIEDQIEALAKDVETRVSDIASEYASRPTAEHYAHIHDELGTLFEGRIGTCPTDDELKALISEGERRFNERMPPGTKDAEAKRKINASEREVFGDFLIWRAAIDHAKSLSKPLIFVTEDAKDDWWLKEEGKTIGPLPELRREFISETGKQVHFYRIQMFLEQSRTRLAAKVSADSVEDVREKATVEVSLEELLERIRKLKDKFPRTSSNSATSWDNFILADSFLNKLHFSPTSVDEGIDEESALYKEFEETKALVNMLAEDYELARVRYRKFSKEHRRLAELGEGNPKIIQARAELLKKKAAYGRARNRLAQLRDLISTQTGREH